MVATKDQKARLLDLTTGVLELTRDGKRNIEEVCRFLQAIKDDPGFTSRFSNQGVERVLLSICPDIENSTTTKPFVVKDNFKKGIAGIVYVSDDFQRLFGGQVVRPRGRYKLQSHGLSRNSRDWGILAEIDGKEETDLALVFNLISLQSRGLVGNLLINSNTNIFYVRDVNDELRAVDVCWDGGGWVVFASPVDGRGAWDVGPRVFSRNS